MSVVWLVALVVTLTTTIDICLAAIAEHRVTSLPGVDVPLDTAQYAGLLQLDNPNQQAFYYYVESRRSPSSDPLILWLNGGPGCASLLGAFTEIGGVMIYHDGVFANNTNSYSNVANLLYLESPPGVGFSMDSTIPAPVWDDEKTAIANYDALLKFFAAYPELSGRPFYISGESYAGHYIPQLAHKILHGPNAALRSSMRGFMVGSPCTGTANGDGLDWCFTAVDPTLEEYYRSHGFAAIDGSIPTNWTDVVYDPYNILERACQWTLEQAVVRWDHSNLRESAKQRLLRASRTPREAMGDPSPPYGPCNSNYLQLWLNRPDVKAALHVDPQKTWEMCSTTLNYPTPTTLPGVLPIYDDLMANTNWSLMIYSGDADTVVNFIQSERVLLSLNRTVLTMWLPWYHRDVYNYTWRQLGGWFVNWDRISFATVKGAGHMAPTTRGPAMLQLLTSYLATGRPGLFPLLVPYDASPPTAPANATCPSDQSESGVSVTREVELVIGGIILGIFASVIIVLILRHAVFPGLARGDGSRAHSGLASRHENAGIDTDLIDYATLKS